MDMLPHVYEKTTGLRWQDEDEAIKKVWVEAWNAAIRAIYQQLVYLHFKGESDE